jgi:restriction system protein
LTDPEIPVLLDYTQSWFAHCRGLDDSAALESPLGYIFQRFNRDYHCPYCNVRTRNIFRAQILSDDSDYTRDEFMQADIYACLTCGWWYDDEAYVDRVDMSYTKVGRMLRCLRSFPANSPTLPLECLSSAILKRPHILHDIHPKRLETFVASVLSDHFDVEVTVVGRSGDGGVDLVYVQSNEPFAVQVKRREDPNGKEGVAVVREFLGACILSQKKNACIVTTAGGFTNGALTSAKAAVDMGVLNSFELVDRARFISLFRYTSFANLYPWTTLARDRIKEWNGRATFKYEEQFLQ